MTIIVELEDDEALLQEIFEAPPCQLKHMNTNEENWVPVNSIMTPYSDSIGLGMDNEVQSPPVA